MTGNGVRAYLTGIDGNPKTSIQAYNTNSLHIVFPYSHLETNEMEIIYCTMTLTAHNWQK